MTDYFVQTINDIAGREKNRMRYRGNVIAWNTFSNIHHFLGGKKEDK